MSVDIDSSQLVIFTLGSEQYALPIGRVQEIIRYQQPRSVVSDDSSVCGVINLRGQIVPVHDLAALLGIDAHLVEDGKIMVLESEEQTVGVIVDSVDEVLTVSGDQLEPAPAAVDTTLIELIAKIGDRLVLLLNANAVITAPTVPV
jgi:purine-binding chemotaxis protein CheW